MKKLAIVASLVAAFGSLGMAQAASTGTITFNGELTATTCDVVVDGQAADATVTLPTIGTNLLQTAGTTRGDTGFVMALNNCAGTLTTASAFFEAGASVDQVTGRLKNMTGGATGVSLQLLDGSSTSPAVIQAGNQNQVTNTTYVDVSSGSANLPYIVRYYAEAPTTAGTVVSNVVYSIQYQ
ncbi:fimbrial protein [Serratia fonticola]|uniref:fimbrial protein n=1 Tax=Serratia fonticola TaxID=47917 RepID=UPI0008FD2156|nr:fimbrial protein [Serratia fonticola]MBC3249038.1 type 1 fimbrial protein [Serratia fonticola]OIX93216.1 fimbrial protein [Serratia fonticola]QCR63155.1 type 1 fimbrial protein [Serratia fonticola]